MAVDLVVGLADELWLGLDREQAERLAAEARDLARVAMEVLPSRVESCLVARRRPALVPPRPMRMRSLSGEFGGEKEGVLTVFCSYFTTTSLRPVDGIDVVGESQDEKDHSQ